MTAAGRWTKTEPLMPGRYYFVREPEFSESEEVVYFTGRTLQFPGSSIEKTPREYVADGGELWSVPIQTPREETKT